MASSSPKKDKEKEQLIGGIDPNAFDAQMLLIDAYIGNLKSVGITTDTGAKVLDSPKAIENVPALTKGPTSINNFMGLNLASVRDSMNSFIKHITPWEMAQIFPKIQFFIVESSSGQQFEIPLTQNPKIDSPSTGVAFYSTQSIGLKSLSLKLDGHAKPFFSKHYVIDAGFSFDSINTFTSRVPGLPITYAEIFRSSGRVGTSIYYTKLAISYDSNNEEILRKYSLRSKEMQFMLVLQLASTKISLQENLKVDITVKYNSREETLFKSNLIFDFLGLDLDTKTKAVKKGLGDVRFKRRALEEAKGKFYEKVRETTKGTSYYKGLESDYEKYKGLVDTKRKFYEEGLTRVRRGTHPTYGSEHEYVASSPESVDLLRLEGELNAVKERIDIVDSSLADSELEKKFKALKPGKDPDEDLDKEERGLRDQLTQIRHDAMVEAVNDTFPTSEAFMITDGIVKTIRLTAQDVYKYYNSELSAADAKTLSSAKGSKKSKSGAAPPKSASTVKVKPKPKKGAAGKPASPLERYELARDDMLVDLGNFKQIDYILFGDIIRLVFKRLYKIKATQIQALSGYKPGDEERALKSIEQSIMLFQDITFEIFEESKKIAGKVVTEKSLYDMPIAVKNLHYIMARNLYGRQKNFFTVFDLIQELIDLISLTRKRKVLLVNDQLNSGNYTITNITYPLLKNPTGAGPRVPYQICTDPYVRQSDLYSGMLFFINRVKGSIPIENSQSIMPEFILGGADRGIIKKFQLEEITDDDIQKMIMEQLTGSDKNEIIPSFFKVNINTILAPIFQLGMHIKILAPTLSANGASARNANFFIDGDYHVRGVTHTYSGGKFSTDISATMYNSRRVSSLKKKGILKKADKSVVTDDVSSAAKDFKKDWSTTASDAAAIKVGAAIATEADIRAAAASVVGGP